MTTQLPRPCTEDISAVYDSFATRAVELFNELGSVAPQLFAVSLDEEEPGKINGMLALEPELVAKLYADNASKDAIKPLVKLFLQEGSPLREKLKQDNQPLPSLMVQITETWYAFPKEDGSLPDPSMSLSESPDKLEGISVFIHTASATHMGICPIVEKPTRHAVFNTIQVSPKGELGRIFGRMGMEPSSPFSGEGRTLH